MIDYNVNPERLRKAQEGLIKFQEKVNAAASDLGVAAKRFQEQNSEDVSDIVKMAEGVAKAIEGYKQDFEDLSKMIDNHLSQISLIRKMLRSDT